MGRFLRQCIYKWRKNSFNRLIGMARTDLKIRYCTEPGPELSLLFGRQLVRINNMGLMTNDKVFNFSPHVMRHVIAGTRLLFLTRVRYRDEPKQCINYELKKILVNHRSGFITLNIKLMLPKHFFH